MTLFVLDASVTVAWLLDDEQDPFALAVHELTKVEGAAVPQHWRNEVRNALVMAVRRGRLDRNGAIQRLRTLDPMEIETDLAPDLDVALSLAFRHRLTFYDALYLELALRRGLPLATLDGGLARAARRAGIEVLSA